MCGSFSGNDYSSYNNSYSKTQYCAERKDNKHNSYKTCCVSDKINPRYGKTYCGNDIDRNMKTLPASNVYSRAMNDNAPYSRDSSYLRQSCDNVNLNNTNINVIDFAELANMSEAHLYRILGDDTDRVSVNKIISAIVPLTNMDTEERINLMRKGIMEKYDKILDVVRQALDEGINDSAIVIERIAAYKK